MNTPTFTFIDLFAGIGGFRLALNRLGGECLHFSEIHNDAINTYCNHFKEESSLNLGDITKVKSLPPHDILTAGVPCQSWSIAGKNLGFDDDRGQLWNDTLYLLNQSRPKAFIFENVKGLADPRNQGALSYILARIRQAGYFAKHFVLNSSDYGVPQDRVKVYIVGFLHEAYLQHFRLPAPQKITMKLADVLQSDVGKSSTPDIDTITDLFGNPVADKRRYRKLNGMNDFFLFNDIRNGPTTIHSWDGIEGINRIFLPRSEACLIQGFPPDFQLPESRSRWMKLVGNSVSVPVIQMLGQAIMDTGCLEGVVPCKVAA
ncbi:MAG: hypothetical protein BWK73_05415 [Thiothrix lacustris]|uniref:Cytosine-specific methyltransferase n=1 Tax=Thiothrix lacustris TaxID=525917 RepID=A0A1Y1QXE7_9GAMM|nr:MAG: hypothetical protein BWK73_05415 [Thiothrix lacustris]